MTILIPRPVLLISVLLCLPACTTRLEHAAIPVSVVKTELGYQLLRDGKPYRVKGAGVDLKELESLAERGGNSFRTWHVETDVDKGKALLDRAHALGLTVSLCLNIRREQQGFNYDNPEDVAEQFELARQAVRSYSDHPALLSWIIGNELNYDFKNPAVFDAVNEISKMIHREDPHHPTTTAIAGFNGDMAKILEERAPDLDFISIQMYGDLINLPRYIQETGFSRPYVVSEWGSIGHWEMNKTAWGAPIELTSHGKAENYLRGYSDVIAVNPHQGIGDYVFFWGQKQERTSTWYGVFTESGEDTEATDVMYYVWNGEWPDNRSPQVRSISLEGRNADSSLYLDPDENHEATINVSDPERDPLRFSWSIKPESQSTQHGGDFEESIAEITGLIVETRGESVTFRTPKEEGPYRLFVYAYDDQGNAGHANFPFFVR